MLILCEESGLARASPSTHTRVEAKEIDEQQGHGPRNRFDTPTGCWMDVRCGLQISFLLHGQRGCRQQVRVLAGSEPEYELQTSS